MNPGWRKQYLRYKAYLNNVLGHYQRRAGVRVYLEIFLSLATVSLFSVFALRPTLLTIAELIKDIEAKKNVVAVLDEKISNLTRAQLLYDQERKRIQLLASAIPNKPEPEILIRQVEGVSSKNATNVNSLTLGPTVILGTSKPAQPNDKPTETDNVSFSLTTSAEYPLLLDLISDIESLRRPVIIDSLNINTSEGKEGKTLTLSVQAKVPFANKLNKIKKQ